MSVSSEGRVKQNFLFCPASSNFDKHGETGSFGQQAFEFIRHLSQLRRTSKATAVVMTAFGVGDIDNVRVLPQFGARPKNSRIYSLLFYLITYAKYRFSRVYLDADVVHHMLPFAPGTSFNLFLIFKDPTKIHVLGPILGPHTDLVTLEDEVTDPPTIRILGVLMSRLFERLSARTIKNADIVLFPDHYAEEAFKAYLAPDQKVAILGFGITPDIYRLDPQPVPERFTALFVGRLTERKGCEYLIKAAAFIKESRPDMDILFKIVGSGPKRKELEILAMELHVVGMVSFEPGVARNADFNSYYNSCSVVCVPALSDTWTVAKEALSCGKPVIITDLAAHSEHVKDGVNGFLVPPRDERALANAILKLRDDPTLLTNLSERAYDMAADAYDWNVLIARYLSLVDGS
jgi:glycosyltransferase involved in cell wall biosynthesis